MLRLDGDMYSSTWDVLTALYRRVPVGGFVIIDDYALSGARLATHDFRACVNSVAQLTYFPFNKASKFAGVGGKAYWRKGADERDSYGKSCDAFRDKGLTHDAISCVPRGASCGA